MIDPLVAYARPSQYEQILEGFVRVLPEFWHDWGERRLISSGDSIAYEYAIGGYPVFALTVDGLQVIYRRHFLL